MMIRLNWVATTVVVLMLTDAVAVRLDSSVKDRREPALILDRKGYYYSHRGLMKNVRALSAHRVTHHRRRLVESDTDAGPEAHVHHHHRRSRDFHNATHPDLALDYLFVPLNRSCHRNCTLRGNCNAEEGRCECPFGYTGPTCEDSLMPACQLGPMLEPFWGSMVPRNCECVRQAHKFFGCSPDAETCTLMSITYGPVRCYLYTGTPPSEQWSIMPAIDAPGLEFFSGPMSREIGLEPVDALEGVTARDIWGRNSASLPLERCEAQCNGRGACIAEPTDESLDALKNAATSREGRCLCYKGFEGDTCGEDMWSLCPNACSDRGQCIRGFCHCKPPYWGLDCSRERAWQLAPRAAPVPNRQVLRIYVYDLPSHVAFPVPLDDNVFDLSEQSYLTHRKFMELLLRDPTVRTENPWEANLFYVPATAYSYASNLNSPENQLASALNYVARNYPWFNASGGRDHFVWTTGDQGSCHVTRNLSHVIFLTLFGLHASLRDGHTTFLLPKPVHHPNYGCYNPRKDVLAAPWYDDMDGVMDAPEVYEKVVAQNGEAPERDLLFSFAGSVRADEPSYSGGARQALYIHLKALMKKKADYKDILFVDGYVDDYQLLYLRSKFCLAPHGAGFGVRLTLAMAHACVPVIIQDTVYQPYESDGILPYAEFSLRLGKADIPQIVPILRSVSAERLRHMRLAMVHYHKAFLWEPSLGGRAYNYTIRALRQRLHGLWGRLWGENGPDGRRRSYQQRHHLRF